MVSIVIAAMVTLCAGMIDGLVLTIAASIPYVQLAVWGTSVPMAPIVMWATVAVSVLGNLFTWLFAVMLRRNSSWSEILQVGALIAVLVVSVIHLVEPDIASWWSSQLQDFYRQSYAMTDMLQAGAPQTVHPAMTESQLETINSVKNYATGIVAAFILITAILQVIVGRWWQAAVFKNVSLRRELHGIHLSRLAGVLFIASLIFYYLENGVVLDILPVLCLLFAAAGLSLVHFLCGLMRPGTGRFCLSLLYIVLMYSLVMIALLPLLAVLNVMLPADLAIVILTVSVYVFAALGLFDVWFNVRKRLGRV